MSFTTGLKQDILDHYFGGDTLTPPGNLYIGLSTTAPEDDGSNFTEPEEEDGYSRKEVDNDMTTWKEATDAEPSVKENDINIEFDEATGDWGEISHFGIFDSDTATEPVVSAPIVDPDTKEPITKQVQNGDVARFQEGQLRIKLQNPDD